MIEEPDWKKIKRRELEKFYRAMDKVYPEDLDCLISMINDSNTSVEQKEFCKKIVEERKELLRIDWNKELNSL